VSSCPLVRVRFVNGRYSANLAIAGTQSLRYRRSLLRSGFELFICGEDDFVRYLNTQSHREAEGVVLEAGQQRHTQGFPKDRRGPNDRIKTERPNGDHVTQSRVEFTLAVRERVARGLHSDLGSKNILNVV
jgi:hypothetical protein